MNRGHWRQNKCQGSFGPPCCDNSTHAELVTKSWWKRKRVESYRAEPSPSGPSRVVASGNTPFKVQRDSRAGTLLISPTDDSFVNRLKTVESEPPNQTNSSGPWSRSVGDVINVRDDALLVLAVAPASAVRAAAAVNPAAAAVNRP